MTKVFVCRCEQCKFVKGKRIDCMTKAMHAVLKSLIEQRATMKTPVTTKYLLANGFAVQLEPRHLRGFVRSDIIVRVTYAISNGYEFEILQIVKNIATHKASGIRYIEDFEKALHAVLAE